MTDLHWTIYLLLAICVFACVQGLIGLFAGIGFVRYVARAVRESAGLRDAAGKWKYEPRVTVILPCCGVDERLHQTVERLGRQRYGAYEVIFTFESADDPAHEAVRRWAAAWPGVRHRSVVAGPTGHRSQKIHNLLAAVAAVPDETEVLVFLDSDAVPNQDWLGHIVAPLADEAVGAATGFRWYCAAGGLANAVRSVWNAPSLTLMEREATRFCWGGATAMRRARFESLEIARHWESALSDDLQVTQAVKAAGLRIVFVPQALIPSHDSTSLRGFWEFARRQLVITRICAPKIWRAGLLLCTAFVGGGTIAAVLCVGAALEWFGTAALAAAAGVLWALIVLLTVARCALRQVAIRKVLHAPDVTWRDALADVSGALWAGLIHMTLFQASMAGRRIRWRHIEYELVSPTQTRVLARHALSGSAQQGPGS